jgi:mono/diheme cytochrome c family protein
MRITPIIVLAAISGASQLCGAHPLFGQESLPEGLRILYEVPMQSFTLTRAQFMELWRHWPSGGLRDEAARLAVEPEGHGEPEGQLYGMLLDYYGLHLDPQRGSDVPAAFATPPRGPGEAEGVWTMNCLACHGGAIAGEYHAGLANSSLMLERFVTDVVAEKARDRTGLDEGMAMAQLGHTVGTTEATLFGELLLRFREPNMDLKPIPGLVRGGSKNVARLRSLPDGLLALDAPAWWQLQHKSHLYLDHSVEKNHRTVMQFTLGLEDMTFKAPVRELILSGEEAALAKKIGTVAAREIFVIREDSIRAATRKGEPFDSERFLTRVAQGIPTMPLLAQLSLSRFVEPGGISGERIRSWDDEFQSIFAFIDGLEAPAYPGTVDAALAERGQGLFNRTCARCHGHYDGSGPAYVSRRIDAAVIGTDALYPTALDQTFRDSLVGFLTEGPDGHQVEIAADSVADEGYVVPPLHGIWASAPYLHNGSVPTVDHLLNYELRIDLEERGEHAWVALDTAAYDHESLGLAARFLEPEEHRAGRRDHRVRSSKRRGMAAVGHDFGEALDAEERRAIIEYLKTL